MIKGRVNSENLVEHLRVAFPELEESYQELMSRWEGERSNYIVVGDVLQPRFIQDLKEGKLTDFLSRCAAFIEKVCTDGDDEAINVIWVRIFEWLIFRPREIETLWPVFGPVTKAKIRDAAHRWSDAARHYGKTENLPENNLPEDKAGGAP